MYILEIHYNPCRKNEEPSRSNQFRYEIDTIGLDSYYYKPFIIIYMLSLIIFVGSNYQ